MTFEEWWDENSDADDICEYLKNNLTIRDVWFAAQEDMRERAAYELEAAFAECDTLNLLHGAARVRALPVE
jgi:hypothetical protein